MTHSIHTRVHDFIATCLHGQNDRDALDDADALFSSGRLDSLHVTRLVVFLEEQFGVDFAHNPFDVDLLDSVGQISEFAAQYGATAARV